MTVTHTISSADAGSLDASSTINVKSANFNMYNINVKNGYGKGAQVSSHVFALCLESGANKFKGSGSDCQWQSAGLLWLWVLWIPRHVSEGLPGGRHATLN